MADEFDRAAEIEEWGRDLAIRQQRLEASRTPKVQAMGYCLNPACWDEFEEGSQRLYCNADCEREHQRIKQLRGE